ncbi:MAG: prolipoprotein diacylglyceryl transferase [Sporomusaceae bacterium]|nr:prolipoprotein diacylglyceryl transferase [Sporomusaceae bacterium]
MHPILFSIGSLEIRAWGLLLALGILAGLWLGLRLARGSEFKEDVLMNYALYGTLAGLIGARLWEVAFSWDRFASEPWQALMLWKGGLSIQGAVAANVLLALWYFSSKGLSFRRFADIGAPGLILGQAIGRIGCFLNGDAYGKPTTAWYGVVYQPGTPAYNAWGTTPLVPAELFEAGADMLILGVLLYLFPRRKFDGQVALAYFVLYSTARFALEFLRTDSLMVGGIKAAQATALVTAVVAAGLMIRYGIRRFAAVRS